MVGVGPHLVPAAPHVLLFQLIAVPVIDIAVGVGGPAGVGILRLVQHQTAPGDAGVGAVDGGGGHLVKGTALGHSIDPIGVCAINFHVQIPFPVGVVAVGDNLDGIVGAVFEPEIQTAIIDSGVHSQLHIAGVELVAVALHHLQIGVEDGVIDGGGGLADAAADVLHRLARLIDGGVLVPLVGGAAAGGIVVGELLPGEENDVVAGLGGQLHVVLAVGRAGYPGGPLPQQVLEHLALQALPGHLGLGPGHGDGEGLPPLGALVGGPQGLHIEVQPLLVVADRHGLQVQLRVPGLGIEGLVDGVKVGLLGLALAGGEGDGAAHLAHLSAEPAGEGVLEGRLRVPAHLLPVHRKGGDPLGHHQLVLLQLVGGVLRAGRHLPLHLGQHPVQAALPLREGHGDLAGAAHHVGQQDRTAGQKALPPHLPGVLDALSGVHLQVGGGKGVAHILIAQSQGDVPAPLAHHVVHRLPGLLHGQIGYIHPSHRHVGQNGIPAPRPDAQSYVRRGQCPRRAASDDPREPAAPFMFCNSLSIHAASSSCPVLTG